MTTIGFSGTRLGMTNKQFVMCRAIISSLVNQGVTTARHGVCKGADAHFHKLCKEALGTKLYIIGHPGVREDGKCYTRAFVNCDLLLPEKPFIKRDRDIVDESNVMLFTPNQVQEVLRSGTWTTIRYARKVNKPRYIIFPDATITRE